MTVDTAEANFAPGSPPAPMMGRIMSFSVDTLEYRGDRLHGRIYENGDERIAAALYDAEDEVRIVIGTPEGWVSMPICELHHHLAAWTRPETRFTRWGPPPTSWHYKSTPDALTVEQTVHGLGGDEHARLVISPLGADALAVELRLMCQQVRRHERPRVADLQAVYLGWPRTSWNATA